MQLESQQEQRRSHILQAVSQGSTVRNRITQAEERLAALERDAQRLNSEVAAANQQLETFGGQRGQLGLEFESATQRVTELNARITETRQKLDELRGAENDGKRHLDGMRSEFAGLMGRRGSLEAVIAEHGYSTESVRRLFKSGALHGGHAPAGVLADFLEVEDRYEHVVEDFLRDELNYIVVKSWDAADEGLAAAAQRCRWSRHLPGSSGRLAGEVLVHSRRGELRRPATRQRGPDEGLHSRAQRFRQVAGGRSCRSWATATSFPIRTWGASWRWRIPTRSSCRNRASASTM